MRPILFLPTATEFTTNGVGTLADAISCVVEEERNGAFELTMKYPMKGVRFSDIQMRSIILAKPNPTDPPQPFRVYEIKANMNGTVTVNAAHLSYDMTGIPIQPFTAASLADALTAIKENAVVSCPFTLLTDKTVNSPMDHAVPSSMRSLLGGTQGSLLDLYGGEWKYNTYTATLLLHRGANNGVVIKYGKNLTDLEQEKNCAQSWTGVYPYWVSQDGLTLVQLPERIIRAVDTATEDRILMLNLSQSEDDAREQGELAPPTVAELREQAQAYIQRNDIFTPKVALKVKFAQLADTEEYADIALLEQVSLCDTVTVVFPKLGVSSSAKVVKTKYDVLLDRYDSVEIGSSRTNITDTIATMQSDINTAEEGIYGAISSAGGSIAGDLSVAGITQLSGAFRSTGASVQIAYPLIWQTALGTYGTNTRYTMSNGLQVDLTKRANGWCLMISGTSTATGAEALSLSQAAPVSIYGQLIGDTGAGVGYFSLQGSTLTVTVSTAGACFAQVYMSEEIT